MSEAGGPIPEPAEEGEPGKDGPGKDRPSDNEPGTPRRGYLAIGAAVGLLFLYLLGLFFIAPQAIPRANAEAPLIENLILWAPLVLYLVLAVVLTVVPRTTRTGAGLLIALGVWLLLGGELCVSAMIARPDAGGGTA